MRLPWRSVGKKAGIATAYAVVFAGASVVGLLVHLDLPPARRALVATVNDALQGAFSGTLTIESVDHVGLNGVEGLAVSAQAPEGQTVLRTENVSGRISLLDFTSSLLFEDGPLRITITEARVRQGEVWLEPTSTGELTIAKTFEPRPSEGPSEPGRSVELRIPTIRLDHVDTHVHLYDPGFDATVDDLRGALRTDADGIVVDIHGAWLASGELPIPEHVSGSLVGQLTVPGDAPIQARANLDMRLGRVPVFIAAQLEGDRLRGGVLIPPTAPEALSPLIPGVNPSGLVSMRVDVNGTLPRLEASGQLDLGDAQTPFLAKADLSSSVSLELHATMSRFDPSTLHASAPKADIDADLFASVKDLANEEPSGAFDVHVVRAQVAGQEVPQTRVWGEFQGPYAEGRMSATSHGATLDGAFVVSPIEAGGALVIASVDGNFPSLRALRPLSVDAEGAGRLHADATFSLTDAPTVQGNVSAEVLDLRLGAVQMKHTSLTASVDGPLESPWIDARVEGRDVRTPVLSVTRYRLDADGPARAPSIRLRAESNEVGKIAASTELDIGDTVVATETTLRVEGEQSLYARAGRVGIGGGGVEVDALRIVGLGGAVEAELDVQGDRMRVRAKGQDLHLARLTSWIPSVPKTRGLVALDVDMAMSPGHLDGHALISLVDGRIEGFDEDVRADIELHARKGRLQLVASAALDDASRVSLDASDVELAGPVFSPDTWKRAVGRGSLEASLDLRRLEPLLTDLPASDLAGHARARVRVRRMQPAGSAVVDVVASTSGLRMKLRSGDESPPTVLEDVDVNVALFADEHTGEIDLRGGLLHKDRYLAHADFETRMPFEQVTWQPSQIMGFLSRSAWTGSLRIPRQSIEAMPAIVQASGVRGDLEASIAVEGPLTAPTVALNSKLSGARLEGDAQLEANPLDITVSGHFEQGRGRASADVETADGTIASIVSNVELNMVDVLRERADEVPWAVSTEVEVNQFPMRLLSAFVGTSMDGCVNGRAELRDLHRDASLHAELWSEEIRIGRAAGSKVQLQVEFSEGELAARAKIDQNGGRLDVRMKTDLQWGAELVPSAKDDVGVESRLEAHNFDLSTLRAVFGVGELAGKLNADLYLKAPATELTAGHIKGYVRLEDGVFNDAWIGQRLHGVTASLRIDESGVARLEDFVVRTASGHLTAAASARLDGLRPVSSRIAVRIADDSPFPVVFQGLDYGTVAGDIEVTTTWRDRLNIEAKIPKLSIELAPKASTRVQSLDSDDSIEVGRVTAKGGFESFTASVTSEEAEPQPEKEAVKSSLPIRIQLKLGEEVRISRGTELNAEVRGQTTVELGDGAPRISGAIEIPRGTVDLRGRRFKIVGATLSVNEEDPSNPILSATAEYIAPGDYVITAQFTGTLKSGELNISSSPSLPPSQILNLIAFGSPDGPAAAESGDGSSAAAGLVGGPVSEGVNALIGDVTTLDVSTRLDTSHEDVRPEVAVQITNEITAQVTFIPTEPSPGQSPDRSVFTLEYRFLPRWTVEASVGDEGTSVLDLLWHYRY